MTIYSCKKLYSINEHRLLKTIESWVYEQKAGWIFISCLKYFNTTKGRAHLPRFYVYKLACLLNLDKSFHTEIPLTSTLLINDLITINVN